MSTPPLHAGLMDILLALVLANGCALSLPIWWWLLAAPVVRRLKRAGKPHKPELP
jgi:hypothetical protein